MISICWNFTSRFKRWPVGLDTITCSQPQLTSNVLSTYPFVNATFALKTCQRLRFPKQILRTDLVMKYRLDLAISTKRTSAVLLLMGVSFSTFYTSPAYAQAPACSSAVFDQDGDGWGWENHSSCIVTSTNSSDSTIPACTSATADPDGDGWGWENNQSCRVSANNSTQSTNNSASVPACASTASDDNNDGWGWENGRSCQVTSDSSNTVTDTGPGAPPPVAAATGGYQNGQPICLTDSSDDGQNGFGYENGRTCVVVSGVTATRSNPLLNQRSCIPWLEIGYGNYRLQNNTWNDSEVYSDNWSQCIELTGSAGNYVAKWDYNWLQRHEGNDYAVKSYPQVYFGRKTRYNKSGTVAETGLPVNINNMPQFWVEYDFSETGNVERNVALESFFHTSCDAEEYNKQYEMMVWVGVPAIRTPGVLMTTVTLSGQEWDVYANPSLGWAYVAFVAKQPSNSGVLDWNAFVNWSRFQGPANGLPAMGHNTCMGAIEIGTETFWGSGTFTLNKFKVN